MERTKILVIGNGFDIAHGLPTRYTDFLDYVDHFDDSRAFQLAPIEAQEARKTILRILGNDNWVLPYFREEYDLYKHNRWIDFEREIANYVQGFEQDYYKRKNKSGIVTGPISDLRRRGAGDLESISVYFDKLKDGFFRLICAFELYIAEIVNRIPQVNYSPDVKDFDPDVVISMNYSNTFQRFYNTAMEYHIHGRADLRCRDFDDIAGKSYEYFRDKNHIVLGMDEYMNEEQRRNQNDGICFRKYYQRLEKRSLYGYKNDLSRAYEVYVFGHSLDKTDSDLIKEVIGNDNSVCTILYHDSNAYQSGLTNLATIFDVDYMNGRMLRDDPSLSFAKQANMVKLEAPT